MKIHNYKKLTFSISLTGVLVLGLIMGRGLMLDSKSEEKVLISSDAIAVAGGVQSYAEQASGIVIGVVGPIEDQEGSSQKWAQVEVEEWLKGSKQEATIKILLYSNGMADSSDLLITNEHVLLFLGKNAESAWVVFGETSGKYLIDDQGNVRGILPNSSATLADLKAQIQSALE